MDSEGSLQTFTRDLAAAGVPEAAPFSARWQQLQAGRAAAWVGVSWVLEYLPLYRWVGCASQNPGTSGANKEDPNNIVEKSWDFFLEMYVKLEVAYTFTQKESLDHHK